jgi:carbonic anhydrase/acetyltransferase-like protein (isoleucine patch superfamily)
MLYGFDGKRPRIGVETYVSPLAQVIGDVTIGDSCYIGHGAILRGDYGAIVIGKGTAVEEGVIVHAPPQKVCTIGDHVTLGHGAIIHCTQIGRSAVIGMGATLSLYSEVGEDTIIAEGGVVRMRQVIVAGVVAGGNPARVLRVVTPKDREYWAWGKQLYVDLAKKYLDIGMEELTDASRGL